MYIVLVCYGCGQFLFAKYAQKTRKCPYCETRLNLVKSRKVARLRTAHEASNYLRALKRNINKKTRV
ncbi:DUF1922 domain-containing protein [Thermoproteota archaeon]